MKICSMGMVSYLFQQQVILAFLEKNERMKVCLFNKESLWFEICWRNGKNLYSISSCTFTDSGATSLQFWKPSPKESNLFKYNQGSPKFYVRFNLHQGILPFCHFSLLSLAWSLPERDDRTPPSWLIKP